MAGTFFDKKIRSVCDFHRPDPPEGTGPHGKGVNRAVRGHGGMVFRRLNRLGRVSMLSGKGPCVPVNMIVFINRYCCTRKSKPALTLEDKKSTPGANFPAACRPCRLASSENGSRPGSRCPPVRGGGATRFPHLDQVQFIGEQQNRAGVPAGERSGTAGRADGGRRRVGRPQDECSEGSNGLENWRIAGWRYYPKATSRIIITEKPAMVAMVTRSMWAGTRWDSGISSSTTTKIMAPAAKQRA